MAKAKTQFIPETPGELTADWLTSVLSNSTTVAASKAVTVQSVQQQTLGEGEGFLGDLVRLTPSYAEQDPQLPATLIAKLPKLANRTMGELLGAYERENMFYMTMADDLPVATPRMYYGEFDRDAGSEKQLEILQVLDNWPTWTHGVVSKLGTWIAGRKQRRYILLIEDIADAAPGDQVKGANAERASAVLRALAKVHAAYWQSTELNGHFWLLPLDVDGSMKNAISKRSWPTFQTTFPDILEAGLSPHCERAMDAYIEDLNALCDAPETLLHGDMRLDNVFFREQQLVFFDWQLVRRGPAAYDIAYLLSGGLPADFGSADGLLDAYHAELLAAGVADYSREDLGRDYELGLYVVLGSLISVDQVDLGDDRGIDMMRLWIERLHARLTSCSAA